MKFNFNFSSKTKVENDSENIYSTGIAQQVKQIHFGDRSFSVSFVLNTLHVLVSTSCVKRSHYNASRATVAISWGKWSEVKVTQSCPTLCDPMDYSVHGILQARILEWEAIPFSRGSSQPRDRSQVSCTAGGFFARWATGKPSWGKALTMMPRTK